MSRLRQTNSVPDFHGAVANVLRNPRHERRMRLYFPQLRSLGIPGSVSAQDGRSNRVIQHGTSHLPHSELIRQNMLLFIHHGLPGGFPCLDDAALRSLCPMQGYVIAKAVDRVLSLMERIMKPLISATFQAI